MTEPSAWLTGVVAPRFLRAAGLEEVAALLEAPPDSDAQLRALERARSDAHAALERAWATRAASVEATRAAAWAVREVGLDAVQDAHNGQLDDAARLALDVARSAALTAALQAPPDACWAALRPAVRHLKEKERP